MTQVVRVVAMGASFLVWLVLALVVMPAAEGSGDGSPLYQHLLGAAFIVWMVWALVAMAYDRTRRRDRAAA